MTVPMRRRRPSRFPASRLLPAALAAALLALTGCGGPEEAAQATEGERLDLGAAIEPAGALAGGDGLSAPLAGAGEQGAGEGLAPPEGALVGPDGEGPDGATQLASADRDAPDDEGLARDDETEGDDRPTAPMPPAPSPASPAPTSRPSPRPTPRPSPTRAAPTATPGADVAAAPGTDTGRIDAAATPPPIPPEMADRAHQAALQARLDQSVKGMVDRGERLPGTGAGAAWVNNKSALANGLISDKFPGYKTCFEQAGVVLKDLKTEQAGGAWPGWKFEEFDATAPWRKGEGIDHMFVKATAPDGKSYQVDPWYGTTQPFVEPKYEPGVWDWASRGNGWAINTVDYWRNRLGRK